MSAKLGMAVVLLAMDGGVSTEPEFVLVVWREGDIAASEFGVSPVHSAGPEFVLVVCREGDDMTS